MSELEQTYFYWNMIYDLIKSERFQLIHVSNGEAWLESTTRGGPILRLVRRDIDWGSWISRDLEEAKGKFNQIKKTKFIRKIKLINIYYSTYHPVDDWEFRLNQEEEIEWYFITQENNISQSEHLYKKFHLPNIPSKIKNMDWQIEIDHKKLQVEQHDKVVKEKEKDLFFHGKPIFTYLFIFVNTIFYFLLEVNGGSENTETLIRFGAKYNPLILGGEWWRFVSPIFLHIGFLHFFMNNFALYFLGSLLERIYGSSRFFIIYLSSGIIGVIASFSFSAGISAGASGAIYGCFGALLAFGVIYPNIFFRTIGINVLLVLGINLIFTIMVPMIDNSAHLGGLVAGFLAASIVYLPKHKMKIRQFSYSVLLAVLMFGLLVYGFSNVNKISNPMEAAQMANHYIQNENYDNANSVLQYILNKRTNEELPAEIFFLKSYLLIKDEEYELAVDYLLTTLQKRETFHEAHYNIALVYLELDQLELARVHIEKALSYDPDNDQYSELYKQLERMN